MAQGKLALKSRIRSVDSTRKITKAMQLVATSKLKKQRMLLDANKEYATELKKSVELIVSTLDERDHPYLARVENGSNITLVFTSDMGLCGGYNANVYRELQNQVAPDEKLVVFGQRGASWAKHNYTNILGTVVNIGETRAYSILAKTAEDILRAYRNQEIARVDLIYTRFVNSVTFEPVKVQLLPINAEALKQEQREFVDTIFEPNAQVILDHLVPMYLKSLLYAYYLETRTSEEASRRMAMESATDNADELKENLELQYNQARQAAITQEISEIVAGADAL
ncbi:MAG: ATP synthase F1 subunit gamma [Erysipelotrichaceae bacterium]